MRLVAISAVLFLVLGTALSVTAQPVDDPESDVMEAVFRYQFEDIGKGVNDLFPDASPVYFLEIQAGDPNDEFLRRFSSHIPPVKKASLSGKRKNGRAIDKETGNPGIIFIVSGVKMLNKSEARVEGGYWEGPRNASGNTYCLRQIEGRWIVYEDLQGWIS